MMMAVELDTLKQEIEELKSSLSEAEADNAKLTTENRALQSLIAFYEAEIEYARDRLKQAIERKQ
jgi:chromosome segregation ATPase